MTPEAQRIAIAEACGWKHCPCGSQECHYYTWGAPGVASDPLACLNAMHEAEKVLTPAQWKEYTSELYDVCDKGPNTPDFSWQQEVCATASQRAEAFLRTIGKWEKSK